MNSSYSILPPVNQVTSFRQPKVGDILVSEWGYDQVNADFYEVIAVTDKSVQLHQLQENETSTAAMFGRSIPFLKTYRGSPSFRRMFKQSGTEYRVRLNSYSSASPWDGQPVEVSHTH